MARGWESKSVESQIADRESRSSDVRNEDPSLLELNRKRERLEMSRRRITRELETASAATHRAALKNALRFLDQELEKLR